MAALEQLGNGVGLIYVTDANNNIIINLDNDAAGASAALMYAQTSAPLSGETLASATVTVTNVAGSKQISNITINGVSIMNATVTGATNALLMANAAANINSFISSPDYSAYVSNGQIVIQPAIGTGATPNGFAIVVSQSGVTYTATNMVGGASASGAAYSTAFNGKRFYINADPAAVVGTISGAAEISASIIQPGALSGLQTQTVPVVTGATAFQIRVKQFSISLVDTTNGDPTATLSSLTTSGFIDGDIVLIRGVDPTHVITITSATGAQKILLSGGVPFSTGDISTSIQLQYNGTANQWTEIDRTPALSFATASVRGQGIPWAVPGVHAVTMSTGGTVTLTPGTDKGIQEITGSPVLASGYNITTAGSPLDGDQFSVLYKATPTVGAQTVTIFGVALTATQAASGKILVVATYSTTASAYLVDVFNDVNGVDWATVASVAGKEPALGNPAANGYLLSSTTGGSRSWIPQPSGFSLVKYASAFAPVGTGANTTETTLQSYTLPANTVSTNYTQIIIECGGSLGANANTKNIRTYLGSSNLLFGSVTLNAAAWKSITTITRTASSALYAEDLLFATGFSSNVVVGTTFSQDFTTDLLIKVTGQNGTATANDITCNYMTVKVIPG